MPAGPAPTTTTRRGCRPDPPGSATSGIVALEAAVRQVTAAVDSPGGPVSVVVVATITPSDGHYDEVRQILLDTIPRVHEEPGCELYSMQEDGRRLVMVEKWESAEALQTHSDAEPLAEAGRA